MKVEIVSCPYQYHWYLNHIGEVFDVKEHPMRSNYYITGDWKNGYGGTIRKEDCKEVFEVAYCGVSCEVIDYDRYNYKLAGQCCFIFKSYCKPIEQDKEMKQEFTKFDLKNFMRVKYRDGCVRVYVDGRFYTNSICVNHINNYNENLLSLDNSDGDIVAVFGETPSWSLSIEFLGDLIWQRKEKSEQEIELEKLQEQIKALEKQAQKLKETLK